MNIDYFKSIQGATGINSLRDLKVKDAVQNFEKQFSSSVNFVRDATRNGEQQEFIIVPIKDNRGSRTMCTIYAHMNEIINISDIIHWNEQDWIIVETENRTQLYNCATMYLCDGKMKFHINDSVYTYPYYTSSLSPSLDTNLQIITSDTDKKIVLPLNDDTRKIYTDMRFMEEIVGGVPQIWKVADATIKKGLLQIMCKRDEYNSQTDDIESGLCDYSNGTISDEQYIPSSNEPISTLIQGNKELKIGFPRTYTARFLDDNGSALSNIPFQWKVICDYNIQQFSDGDSVELFIEDRESIDSQIILQILDTDNNIMTESIITIIDSF